jgi:hypothetical protein
MAISHKNAQKAQECFPVPFVRFCGCFLYLRPLPPLPPELLDPPPFSARAIGIDPPPRSARAIGIDPPPRSARAIGIDPPPRSARAIGIDPPPLSARAIGIDGREYDGATAGRLMRDDAKEFTRAGGVYVFIRDGANARA